VIGAAVKMPNVRNELRDAEDDITYVVMAYRRLTRGELVMTVRAFHSNRRSKKKLKKGITVTILSLIGGV